MRFEAGQVVMTSTVAAWVGSEDARLTFIGVSLQRHLACDWGNVGKSDAAANNRALREGDRLLSVYNIPATLAFGAPARKLWVISEGTRECTTILFPGDD